MERDPWWRQIAGPFPVWDANPSRTASPSPTGVKADGGGCIRGQGRVGTMALHRAVCRQDAEGVRRLVSERMCDVNEVEAAGNTPLHNAAFEGWTQGCELLIRLGAKVNASNNAGDTPWHFANGMQHDDVMTLLERHGATKVRGGVLVQEHVPKVREFYAKPCWAHHPKPYADFMEFKAAEASALEESRKKAIRV